MRRTTYFQQFNVPQTEPLRFEPLGAARLVARSPTCVGLKSGQATVGVTALAPDLFRVGLFGEGRPVDYRSEAQVRCTTTPARASLMSRAIFGDRT